jgi:hypothetical protein
MYWGVPFEFGRSQWSDGGPLSKGLTEVCDAAAQEKAGERRGKIAFVINKVAQRIPKDGLRLCVACPDALRLLFAAVGRAMRTER